MSQDALTGWDDDTTAESYAVFTRTFPMYSASSRDLARRAHLTDSRLVVDLCGGTGATAEAILALAPPDARVISLDSAAAMQRIGRRGDERMIDANGGRPDDPVAKPQPLA